MSCRARTFEVGLHWRRSLKGEVQEVSEGLQFEMVPKCNPLFQSSVLCDCRHQCCCVCLSSRWFFVPLFNLFVSRRRCILFVSRRRCSLMNEREGLAIVLHTLCSTLPTFQATDAQHFARPRGILVVAQPSNYQALHSAHHGWSHLVLHSATELWLGERTNAIAMS